MQTYTHCRCMTCSYSTYIHTHTYTHTHTHTLPPEGSRGSWQLFWVLRGGGSVCVLCVWQCFLWSGRRLWLEGLEERWSCVSQRSDAWIHFLLPSFCCLPFTLLPCTLHPHAILTPLPFISHHIAPKRTCSALLWAFSLTNFPYTLLFVCMCVC